MKLTENQRRFADEYIKTGNITKSYLKAYKNVKNENSAAASGSVLLRLPKVAAYVHERLELLKKESIAEQDEVLQLYTRILRGEETEEVVLSTISGVETVNKIPDIRDRQRAAEELMKRYTLGNNQVLRDRLLEAQIRKTAAETKNEMTGIMNIKIVDAWDDDNEEK